MHLACLCHHHLAVAVADQYHAAHLHRNHPNHHQMTIFSPMLAVPAAAVAAHHHHHHHHHLMLLCLLPVLLAAVPSYDVPLAMQQHACVCCV